MSLLASSTQHADQAHRDGAWCADQMVMAEQMDWPGGGLLPQLLLIKSR